MGDWNDLVNEINTTKNTVENILRIEEEKNQVNKVQKGDWNELVSATETANFLQQIENEQQKYQGALKSLINAHLNSNSRSLPLTYARCAHPVLIEGLAKVSSRGLVYQSWSKLVETEIRHLSDTHPDTTLRLALSWFLVMYPRFKLNESILYGIRIQLFVQFSDQVHASLAHGIKELMRMCLAQQPIGDLIQIILIDISKWLSNKYPPANPPQEPIPYDECLRSIYQGAFRTPDVEIEHRMHKLLRDPATRTDTALALISSVKIFLSSKFHILDLKEKVGWCLTCISNNIRPFPPPAPGIPPLLDNIDYITRTFENMLDLHARDHLANLKNVLTHMFDQKIMQASFSEPKYDIEITKPTSKAPEKQRKEEVREEGNKEEDTILARPNTARYHKEGYERVNKPVAKIAHVEDVWLQVEPVSIPANGTHSTSAFFGKGNLLTSTTKGTLVFNLQQILWVPVSQQENAKENPLAIKYERVTQHTGGIIKEAGGEHYYLSLQAHESSSLVYYFFPFSLHELAELQRVLHDVCGKGPSQEVKYMQSVLDQKITAQRVHVLRQLLQDPRPNLWISDMDTLNAVIKTLTSITVNKTDEVYQIELERLFHSCRRNDEVAVETVTSFRDMWDNVPEAIHLKILAIIDRLLDRALMHVDSPAFWALNNWLDHIEKTLNPYKNSKALEIVYELKHRVQMLKKHTLVPLSAVDLLQYANTQSVK